jgi:hypothetical protein
MHPLLELVKKAQSLVVGVLNAPYLKNVFGADAHAIALALAALEVHQRHDRSRVLLAGP